MDNGRKSVSQFWQSLNGQRRILIFFLTLSDLLAYLGISVIAPFFPKEANDRGVSNTVSGWVFGLYSITKALSCPIFGKLLPHVGARFMYLSGMFVSACCTILFGFCAFLPTDDGGVMFATFCMVVRVVLALGMSAYVTAGFTIIALEYHDQISFVFSIVQAGVGVGFIVGPTVGGLLYHVGGFLFPFIVLGGIQLTMLIVNFFAIPRRPEYAMNYRPVSKTNSNSTASTSSTIPILSLIAIPLILFIMLGTTTVGVLFGCLDATLEPGLRPHGVDTITVSFCFLSIAAAYTIASPIVGWSCQFIPAYVIELIGVVGMVVSELVMCRSPILGFPEDFFSLPLTFVALTFTGLFGALVIVPSFEWMKRTAVERGHEDTIALSSAIGGLWNSSNAFGEFLGPVLAGFLLDLVGFEWGLTIVATLTLPLIIGLISICVLLRFRRPTAEKSIILNHPAKRYDREYAATLATTIKTAEDYDDDAPLLGSSRRSSFRAPNFRWQTLSV